MTTFNDLQREEERLLVELAAVRRTIEEVEGPKLGNLPNSRAGFYHIHSDSYECGMAYQQVEQSDPDRRRWAKCSKLVNHRGGCGYEDNSAY